MRIIEVSERFVNIQMILMMTNLIRVRPQKITHQTMVRDIQRALNVLKLDMKQRKKLTKATLVNTGMLMLA